MGFSSRGVRFDIVGLDSGRDYAAGLEFAECLFANLDDGAPHLGQVAAADPELLG